MNNYALLADPYMDNRLKDSGCVKPKILLKEENELSHWDLK